MLGYGGTEKPLAAEEYSTKKLCADLAALLDVVGVSKAVSISVARIPLSEFTIL
jgi:soluble epoxide hydrolase/lipid-phosphate phosphatase